MKTLVIAAIVVGLGIGGCRDNPITAPTTVNPPPQVRVIVEHYSLSSIAGYFLPLSYSEDGESWDIVGGEYVLASDSTFSWGYDVHTADTTMSDRVGGNYLRTGPTIVFYFDGYGGESARGTVAGDTLTVTYTDSANYAPEVYYRVTPSLPRANSAGSAAPQQNKSTAPRRGAR